MSDYEISEEESAILEAAALIKKKMTGTKRRSVFVAGYGHVFPQHVPKIKKLVAANPAKYGLPVNPSPRKNGGGQ